VEEEEEEEEDTQRASSPTPLSPTKQMNPQNETNHYHSLSTTHLLLTLVDPWTPHAL
jgi:hypothetical protein